MRADCYKVFTLAFVALFILAPVCFADDVAKDPVAMEADAAAHTRNRVVSLSKLTPEQVDSLRANNYGWGEILHVGAFVANGQSYDAIVADRASGMGWGEIAKKYGVKFGDIKKSVHAGIKDAKKAVKGDDAAKKELGQLKKEADDIEKSDKKADKAEKPAKMDKADKLAKPDHSSKPDHPAKPTK